MKGGAWGLKAGRRIAVPLSLQGEGPRFSEDDCETLGLLVGTENRFSPALPFRKLLRRKNQ
jgi:hypothetical protein